MLLLNYSTRGTFVDNTVDNSARIAEARKNARSYAPGESRGEFLGRERRMLSDGRTITFAYYAERGGEFPYRYATEPEYRPGKR